MDIDTLAYQIVQQSIGEEPKGKMANRGIARAKSLTAQERKDIAMKAAQTRWKNRGGASTDPRVSKPSARPRRIR